MRYLLVALFAFIASVAHADSDRDCYVVAEAINPTEAQGTVDYVNLTDGTFGTSITADDEFTIPTKVKAWSLYADVDVAPGAGDTWSVLVLDDGAATSLTCNISGTDTSCENVSNVASIAKGSDLVVAILSSVGATDPAAAAEMRFSFCLDY